ncbi:cytochrome P450 [Xylariaceae sp. FL0804]|nr:cytochrome P450 [Xylariaceae sp. FL0804]
MGYALNTALLGLALVAFSLFRRQRLRQAAVLQYDCVPARSHQTKEPFFGLDFQLNMYGDIPFLYHLHQKYGSTYQVRSWVSLPVTCTTETANLRVISTSRDFGVEPMRLRGLGYFCGRGFITTDGETWSHARRLLKPSFELSNISNISFLQEQVDELVLKKLPKDSSVVDLQPHLYILFLHSALHFVLGVNPSTASPNTPLTPDEFLKAFHNALFYSMVRVVLGPVWNLLPQSRYRDVCAKAHSFIGHFINQAHEDENVLAGRSLIQALSLQTQDPVFIKSQVIQAMIAAQDTTSELLTNALFLLSRHPKYWERLRAEFVGMEDNLSVENLLSSKLTENIINETLRLHPIFPLLGRVALRDTKLPLGGGLRQDRSVFIPKGSTVVMSNYALHRNPEVFGDDVETFNPDRWNSIKPRQWEFLGFGSGHRACLGQHKALIEASYVLARLAQSVERLTSADSREWKGEMKLTCKSANGCKVRVH